MKIGFLSLIGLVLCCAAWSANTGFKAHFVSGAANLKAGSAVSLLIASDSVRVMAGDTPAVEVMPSSITEIFRRSETTARSLPPISTSPVDLGVGLLNSLRKSDKCFVQFRWNANDKAGSVTLQVAPAECGNIVSSLEAASGKQVVSE